MMDIIGVWLAAFLTLAIMSFLFGDNPVYKFVEHIFVGASAAFGIIVMFNQAIWPYLYEGFTTTDAFLKITTYIAIFIGILTLFRLEIMNYVAPNLTWISRFPIAFVTGVGTGIGIVTGIHGFVFPQIVATFLPLLEKHASAIEIASNLILVLGVLASLYYFYFSMEQRGILKGITRLGMVIIMITFGAAFGYTVMARVSLLIGRIYFLISDWLHLVR